MQGKIEIVTGPMFSGKSAELLVASRNLANENLRVGLYQSVQNTRDDGIKSRNGDCLPAVKIKSLREIASDEHDAIIIDELHFFSDVASEVKWLQKTRQIGKVVVAGVLDYDFSGKEMPIYSAIRQIGPDTERKLTARCDEIADCVMPAEYSARLLNGQQLLEGPRILVDGVKATYSPRCKDHYLPITQLISEAV